MQLQQNCNVLDIIQVRVLVSYELRVSPVPIARVQVQLHSFLASVNFMFWSLTGKNPGTQ
jgi:hypothetical protein